jgi:hypothetical protein
MATNPTKHQVVTAYTSASADLPNYGRERLRAHLKATNPTWQLSAKVNQSFRLILTKIDPVIQRLKKMVSCEQTPPQGFMCALIPADGLHTTPAHREYVEGSIGQVTFPMQASNPLTLKYAAILLQCDNVVEISKFYDRDSSVVDWYYQAFAAETDDAYNAKPNSIANILKDPKVGPVQGDILVMKNGPLNGQWETYPDVNVPSLARTIWWYRGSGRDISTVFGERGLLRVIGNLQQ